MPAFCASQELCLGLVRGARLLRPPVRLIVFTLGALRLGCRECAILLVYDLNRAFCLNLLFQMTLFFLDFLVRIAATALQDAFALLLLGLHHRSAFRTKQHDSMHPADSLKVLLFLAA